jgi:hypothetical protein
MYLQYNSKIAILFTSNMGSSESEGVKKGREREREEGYSDTIFTRKRRANKEAVTSDVNNLHRTGFHMASTKQRGGTQE